VIPPLNPASLRAGRRRGGSKEKTKTENSMKNNHTTTNNAERECRGCGCKFPKPEYPRHNATCCSDACTYKYRQERHKERDRQILAAKPIKVCTCPVCNNTFTPNRNQKYCSPECSYKMLLESNRRNPRRRSPPCSCKMCKKEFQPTYYNRRYCSDQCSKRYTEMVMMRRQAFRRRFCMLAFQDADETD
jgi:hypothetical protein